jgi:alkylated DNA repair dioxygenase AlkB
MPRRGPARLSGDQQPDVRQPDVQQPDLFAAAPALPMGFVYRDAALSADEERRLVERFAALPLRPFEFHGYLGKRRVLSFGWRYDYASAALQPGEPIPAFLLDLRERAAAALSRQPDRVQQVLVTEYAPGAGIGWHRDKPVFGEVAAFSFLSPCRLRLRRRTGECRTGQSWERRAVEVQPRSLYLLRGPVRHDWQHSVPPVEALRYAVTFRTLVDAPL